jgi:ABC-type phosphate/phosphonate transport system ATPase subunit
MSLERIANVVFASSKLKKEKSILKQSGRSTGTLFQIPGMVNVMKIMSNISKTNKERGKYEQDKLERLYSED